MQILPRQGWENLHNCIICMSFAKEKRECFKFFF